MTLKQYSMQPREKLLSIRETVSSEMHQHLHDLYFDQHINDRMGVNLGRAIAKQIPATKEYNEDLDSYIYETRVVVLTPKEYKELLDRIDNLEYNLSRTYRTMDNSIDGWYRQGL